jgi:glycerate kinase
VTLRVVVAPDSFKGSLSATQVAQAIGAGVLRAVPDAELVLVPLADGGEGTVDAFVTAVGGQIVAVSATDPLGERVESFVGLLDDGETAIVEMAAASGLPLVPDDKRNPMLTTSYGTGELIKAALDLGCRKLILGIGGSATNDGGVGMVQSLGGSFRDEAGAEVGFGGKELARVRSIDASNLDPRLHTTSITVACDVENPLTGPNGASAIFGPQKGATPEMVETLDAGLRNLAEVIRRGVGTDIETTPGSGAAGGMGGAALAFLGAKLKPGIEIILAAARFDEKLNGASLVITGEGRVDAQTLQGKVVNGVLRDARAHGVPVVVLAGGIEPEGYALLDHGATALLSIADRPMPLAEAQERAAELLEHAAEQAMRLTTVNAAPHKAGEL